MSLEDPLFGVPLPVCPTHTNSKSQTSDSTQIPCQDRFLVLACDGIWDVMDDEEDRGIAIAQKRSRSMPRPFLFFINRREGFIFSPILPPCKLGIVGLFFSEILWGTNLRMNNRQYCRLSAFSLGMARKGVLQEFPHTNQGGTGQFSHVLLGKRGCLSFAHMRLSQYPVYGSCAFRDTGRRATNFPTRMRGFAVFAYFDHDSYTVWQRGYIRGTRRGYFY